MIWLFVGLGIIAVILIAVARIFRNMNAPAVEAEATKRLEDRLEFRRNRWRRWRNNIGDKKDV